MERIGGHSTASLPRVAALGTHTTSLGVSSSRLVEALDRRCDVRAFGPVGLMRALREGACAIGRDGCELLHLFDPRLVPVGLLLRARYGVPVSMTLDGLRSRRAPVLAGRVDQIFVDDMERARQHLLRFGRTAVTCVPPIATPPPPPAESAERAYRRLLRGTGAGRLAVGLVWPSDREHLRWFRDAVAPLLFGDPAIVLIGAPNVRDARVLFGRRMPKVQVRTAALSGVEIAAAARFVDVFVVPGAIRRAPSQTEALLALASTGAPLLAGGAVRDDVLQHERNALLVEPGDAMGLASSLNKLLTLPPQQRHYLGRDFAEYTFERSTPEAAADLYAERFAALVGRPRIPVELLRAA